MTGTAETRNPVVLWAQRKDCVYLTISVEDCKDADLKIEADKVVFKGTGGDKNSYACTLVLNQNLKPADSRSVVRDRAIEMLLIKENDGYWPRLLKDSTKVHWLKVDFNKWKDEDDSDEDMAGGDFEEMMKKMGGFGSGGGDIGDMGEEDSDDDEMPDLEVAKDNKEEERKE